MVGGADEKQTEYKSLRTRRELATAPAWVLSRGIEMAKTENRKRRAPPPAHWIVVSSSYEPSSLVWP